MLRGNLLRNSWINFLAGREFVNLKNSPGKNAGIVILNVNYPIFSSFKPYSNQRYVVKNAY